MLCTAWKNYTKEAHAGAAENHNSREEDKYDCISPGIYIDGTNIGNLFLLLY